MTRFQDCLGEHQDAVTAMARIQGLAAAAVRRSALAPERFLELGALIQVQREIARDRRARLARLWSRFDRRSVRPCLGGLGGAAPQNASAGDRSATAPA
jgi:hypothetical protein